MRKSTYRFIFLIVGLFIIIAIPMISCSKSASIDNQLLLNINVDSTPFIKNPPPEEDELYIPEITDDEWTSIKTFTGTDNDTTLKFPISGEKWRIRWAIDAIYPEYTTFDVFIYSDNEGEIFKQRFSHTGEGLTGTEVIEQGAGVYYMKVIATNLYRWSIVVDNYATQAPDSPVQITHIYYKGRDLLKTIEINETIVEADEYVEITNMSDTPQSISGWRLKNLTSGFPTFTFPSYYPYYYAFTSEEEDYTIAPIIPCILEPYHSIRVYTGEIHYESGGFCFYYLPGNIWNNTVPDTAVLYSSHNREASRKSYVIAPLSNTD
jgi:hypothetical protein